VRRNTQRKEQTPSSNGKMAERADKDTLELNDIIMANQE
jgi:hypothetical protein